MRIPHVARTSRLTKRTHRGTRESVPGRSHAALTGRTVARESFRHVQVKRRAFARLGLGPESRAEQLGCLSGDEESEAHALLAVRFAAREGGEEGLHLLGGDAGA